MITRFVSLTMPLDTAVPLAEAVEAQLRQHGEPLRWAITAVNGSLAQIEAIVTTGNFS